LRLPSKTCADVPTVRRRCRNTNLGISTVPGSAEAFRTHDQETGSGGPGATAKIRSDNGHRPAFHTTQPCKHLSPSYTFHLIRLLAELSKKPRASRIQVLIMEFQRAIVVTRFAVLDFHWALSDARRQSDKVDSVQCTIPTRLIASINFLNTTY